MSTNTCSNRCCMCNHIISWLRNAGIQRCAFTSGTRRRRCNKHCIAQKQNRTMQAQAKAIICASCTGKYWKLHTGSSSSSCNQLFRNEIVNNTDCWLCSKHRETRHNQATCSRGYCHTQYRYCSYPALSLAVFLSLFSLLSRSSLYPCVNDSKQLP